MLFAVLSHWVLVRIKKTSRPRSLKIWRQMDNVWDDNILDENLWDNNVWDIIRVTLGCDF